MKPSRPINLNLFTIKFPLPAIVSILHRISGVIMFLFIPILLCLLSCSLRDETSFNTLQADLSPLWIKSFLWIFMAALAFHFTTGIRHLLSDMQIGMSLKGSKTSAITALFIAITLILLVGYWLCY